MTYSEIEQSAIQPDGSPDNGSLVPVESLDDLFGPDESAAKPPETQSETAEEIQPEEAHEEVETESIETSEEELPPAIKQQLEILKQKEAELDQQKAGMEKYFTEQSERFKKLREEAGVEEIHKDDKSARKDTARLGFDAIGEYVYRDLTKPLTDEVLTRAVQQKIIPANMLEPIKAMKPVLNTLLNDLRKEVLTSLRDEVESVHGEYKPIKERIAENDLQTERHGKWTFTLGKFFDEYKPTDEQKAAMREEMGKPEFWAIVDKKDHPDVVKELRRIINDPEVIKKSAVKPVKTTAKKELTPEAKKQRTEQTQASFLDNIFD